MIVCQHNKLFWSITSESHTKIREDHKLPDNDTRIVNVQIEIVPPDNDYTKPLEQWLFVVDQDRLPLWWDSKTAEAAVRAELPNWAKARLLIEGTRNLKGTDFLAVVAGSGRVGEIHDSGQVGKIHNSGRVGEIRNSGRVGEIRNSGQVGAIYDNGRVGSIYDNGRVGAIYDNGQVGAIYGTGRVGAIYGAGQVGEIRDMGTARFYCPFEAKLRGTHAVIIDSTGPTTRCIVGTSKLQTVKVERGTSKQKET